MICNPTYKNQSLEFQNLWTLSVPFPLIIPKRNISHNQPPLSLLLSVLQRFCSAIRFIITVRKSSDSLSLFLFLSESSMRRRVVDRTFDSDMGSSGSDGSGKERLKWTLELHDLFEKAVNQLGGPDRATPKGILKAMGIPALTIYHVKSHLQKYRISKFISESCSRGKFERRNISEMMPNFSTTSGAQLNEALQMQKEVESRLSDQLQIQRSLKLKIEAQARFLQGIAEDFKNRAIVSKHGKAFSPISPPSLCEESDLFGKEFESDSEIDKAEVTSEEECRAPKRLRIEENVLMPRYMVASLDSESFNQSMLLQNGARARYSAYETRFPWSVTTYKSPLMPSLYNSYNY